MPISNLTTKSCQVDCCQKAEAVYFTNLLIISWSCKGYNYPTKTRMRNGDVTVEHVPVLRTLK